MAVPELMFDNYLARVPSENRHKLDYKIENDAELAEIAESYTDWQGTRPYLGLKAPDEEDIQVSNRSFRVQRRVVLQRWRERQGYRATYKNLALCFYKAHRPDMVQAVLERLGASFSADDNVKKAASMIVHQTTSQSPQGSELQLHDVTHTTTLLCGTTESLPIRSGAASAPLQLEPEPNKHPRQMASARGGHSHPSDKVFTQFPVSAEETLLGIEDLRYVVRVLHLLAHKWNNIGTVLRVRSLDNIRKKFPNDPQRCLIAMLSDWLNGQYDTQRAEPPSWRMVVYALADRGGGDHRQRAEYVAKNHKGLTQIQFDENVDACPLVTADSDDSDSDEQDMEDAVRKMASELYAVAQRWYQVGLQLGVEVHRLEEICGSDRECLETMLKTGIETDPDCMTWRSIVEAVGHPAGGNNSVIADSIAAKYSIQAVDIH